LVASMTLDASSLLSRFLWRHENFAADCFASVKAGSRQTIDLCGAMRKDIASSSYST
jgi:hypothetical protein